MLPEDDYAGRLVASVTEFRMWALANPREFGLVFANPVADAIVVAVPPVTHPPQVNPTIMVRTTAATGAA